MYIFYGIAQFSNVDSAIISNCNIIDNIIGTIPQLFSITQSGNILFSSNVVKRFGEIKAEEFFTGRLRIDKNKYFHPKNILLHTSSTVYFTNNLIYTDSSDVNSYSLIDLYSEGYSAKSLKLILNNNIWFKKTGIDDHLRLNINSVSSNDSVIISNNIFYGFVNFYNNLGATVSFTYNAYDPESGINNNINTAEVKFIDTLSENSLNLKLRYNSAGINAGDPHLTMSAYPNLLDLANNTRIYKDTVDLGAYEFIPLQIINQLSDSTSVCEGSSLSYTITSNFTPNIFQWQSSTDKINWENVGDNTNDYNIPNATVFNNDTTISYIRCIIKGIGFENDTSNITTLQVYPNLNVVVDINVNINRVCEGSSVVFTANSFQDGSSPTYYWFVNDFLQNGENNNTFTYTPQNNDEVYCQIVSSETCINNSSAFSDTISITVYPSILINSFVQPQPPYLKEALQLMS